MKGCRDGFGDGLVALGRNKKVVALCADLSPSTRMDWFQKKFPDRYFDVGVAEQNLVTVASGLAHVGKIPFVSGFGAFVPGRCWEQIRTTICYNDQPVKIIASHTGLNVGEDGATHQVLEDVALMRSLPNMTVVVPADYDQAKKATLALAKHKGPCYMRFGRYKSPQITTAKTPFTLGKAQVLRQGFNIALIGCGPLVDELLQAAEVLAQEGIEARVLNVHTIKPLDTAAIVKAAAECGKIITIEDHQATGGLGSAVAEVISKKNPVPVVRLGVQDQFGESGDGVALLKKHGLTAANVARVARTL